MLRRNLDSDFVGGAFVFPGGAVDPEDRHDDLEAVCRGRTDADASARLGIERGGLAFWVAAIRESFEEAGVLLAYHPDGDVIRLADPETNERFAAHRAAVDGGQRRLVEICEEEGLQLAVDAIWYFGHWITPVGAPRRYDTRFFVTLAPPAQTPVHDDHEVIANTWIRPKEALARHGDGDFDDAAADHRQPARGVAVLDRSRGARGGRRDHRRSHDPAPRHPRRGRGAHRAARATRSTARATPVSEPLGRWPSVGERSRLAITRARASLARIEGRDGPGD